MIIRYIFRLKTDKQPIPNTVHVLGHKLKLRKAAAVLQTIGAPNSKLLCLVELQSVLNQT